MTTTFTADEIKKFGIYSKDIADEEADDSLYCTMNGIEKDCIASYAFINRIWGILFDAMDEVDYDLNDGKPLTVNLSKFQIEFIRKVVNE